MSHFGGERFPFSTKLEINPTVWNNKSGKVKGDNVKAVSVNNALGGFRGKATVYCNRLMDVNKYAYPRRLKKCLVRFR